MKNLLLAASLTMILSSHAMALGLGDTYSPFRSLCQQDEAFFQRFNSWDHLLLGKTYEAKDVVVDLVLNFGPDNTYYANYSEYRREKQAFTFQLKSGGPFTGLFSKSLKGKYTITQENELVLENLGVGSGEIKMGEMPLMNFTFTHAVNDLGLVGKTIQMNMLSIAGGVCLKVN